MPTTLRSQSLAVEPSANKELQQAEELALEEQIIVNMGISGARKADEAGADKVVQHKNYIG